MPYVASPHLKDLNSQTTKEEIVEVYRKYAPTYDEESHTVLGYAAPESAAKALQKHAEEAKAPKDMRILDAGAGTGLAGEWMYKLGFTNLDALDASPDMIEKAKLKMIDDKNLYQNFYVAFLGDDLDIETDAYDSIISVGTFAMGHARGNAMPELVRIVKPGGLICFTVRNCVLDDPEYEFNVYMQKLIDEKKWKLLAKTQEPYLLTVMCTVFVYQVTKS